MRCKRLTNSAIQTGDTWQNVRQPRVSRMPVIVLEVIRAAIVRDEKKKAEPTRVKCAREITRKLSVPKFAGGFRARTGKYVGTLHPHTSISGAPICAIHIDHEIKTKLQHKSSAAFSIRHLRNAHVYRAISVRNAHCARLILQCEER